LSISFLCFSYIGFAQDDMLSGLEDSTVQKARPLTSLFKSSRLVNGHTTETVAKNHLDFKIHHRFGKINDGAYKLWGLDAADMMLGFEYGITKKLTVGILRNTYSKMYTGNIKYKFFGQTGKGKHSHPFTMTYYGNISVNSLTWKDQGVDPNRTNYFTSRLTYINQLLFAKKFGENVTLQFMPMHYHQNLVHYNTEPNDLFVLGIGGSFKMTRSSRLNIEYLPVVNKDARNNTINSLSIGVDVETGGHVFQLVMSNSRGMVENAIIPYTTGKWSKGDLYFGFNLLRYFSMKR
ncbi:MAG: hypothetical protein HYZ42_07100, partial [Bacteroidetes bacterium]|nr:hypothetical protein [Bacteroidota bacterium]